LKAVGNALAETNAPSELIEVARRTHRLVPTLPLGVTRDTWERHLATTESSPLLVG
jgi:hypothetical protein